jgi:chaperonin GroES
MATKLRPIFDRVTVHLDAPKDQSEGGILLAKDIEDHQTGTVLDVGPGKRNTDGTFSPSGLKPGDRVVFSKYCGAEMTIGGKNIKLLFEEEIYGPMEEVPE